MFPRYIPNDKTASSEGTALGLSPRHLHARNTEKLAVTQARAFQGGDPALGVSDSPGFTATKQKHRRCCSNTPFTEQDICKEAHGAGYVNQEGLFEGFCAKDLNFNLHEPVLSQTVRFEN